MIFSFSEVWLGVSVVSPFRATLRGPWGGAPEGEEALEPVLGVDLRDDCPLQGGGELLLPQPRLAAGPVLWGGTGARSLRGGGSYLVPCTLTLTLHRGLPDEAPALRVAG